jgi:hypothetical protein
MEGFKGRKFFAREPKRSHAARAIERGAEQKNYLYIFCFARAVLFLKGKGGSNFSARQCRLTARRRGGAIEFFQEFLLK